MAENSGIEWLHGLPGYGSATWNPTTGCGAAGPGCKNCYAKDMTYRLERIGQSRYVGLTVLNQSGSRHFNDVVRTHDDMLEKPLRWRKPRVIFVNSMSDLFHEDVPTEFIDKVFAVMALCRRHRFIILTKRSQRMREYFDDGNPVWDTAIDSLPFGESVTVDGTNLECRRDCTDEYYTCAKAFPLPNVALGVSVSTQACWDEHVTNLMQTPAAVRIVSAEPLLGPVKMPDGWASRIDWVIVGGESGPKARPMHPDWARGIRDQCVNAGVPFFFKQWGEWCGSMDAPPHSKADYPFGKPGNTGVPMFRVGKKAAGRLLDGREWNELPAEWAEAVKA